MPFSKSDFLKDAEAFLGDAEKHQEDDLVSRMDLLRQLELLKQQLERPMDKVVNQWISVNVVAAIKCMIEFDVFEKIPLEGSITAQELSSLTGLDSSIIIRLMRIIIGAGIIAETGDDTYSHAPASRDYLKSGSVDFFNFVFSDFMLKPLMSLPSYLRTHTASDLYDPTNTPFSCANSGEGKTLYNIFKDNPEVALTFNKGMKLQEPFLPTLGMFPFESIKDEVQAEQDRPFIVDLGGGRGHMLEIIRKATEGGYGARMILQDRPEVLENIPADDIPGIERMAHDFYTPQPIKNAHIYYLRRVMHNYQDSTCIEILKNVAVAMGPNSRVLIGEIVIPSRVTVAGEMTGYWKDIAMLVVGGRERSAKEFAEILHGASLELVKIWPFKTGSQAVVEARLKRE